MKKWVPVFGVILALAISAPVCTHPTAPLGTLMLTDGARTCRVMARKPKHMKAIPRDR